MRPLSFVRLPIVYDDGQNSVFNELLIVAGLHETNEAGFQFSTAGSEKHQSEYRAADMQAG